MTNGIGNSTAISSNVTPFPGSNVAPADINRAGLPGKVPAGGYRSENNAELAAAYNYQGQGLCPIPITPRTKKAAIRNWQKVAVEEHEFPQHWGGATPCGIALPLGGRSKGLIDMDLDWPEARELADALIFIYGEFIGFGRKSAVRSHRLAFCEQALNTDECKTVAFAIPASIARKLNLTEEEHAANVLEVRGNGGYTIFPPSVHASGERIEWDNVVGRSLPQLEWADIMFRAGLLAFLAFMIRFYPPVGMRNDFNLALGGALLRALREKYGEDEVQMCEQVDAVVTTVCRLAGDQGHGASWEKRATNTLARIKGGAQVTGLPKLLEIIGVPEMEKTLRRWLGADSDDRPIIDYDDTRISDVINKAEEAMLAVGPALYQSSGRIVHAVRFDSPQAAGQETDPLPGKDGVRRPPGALQIRAVQKHRLKEYFSSAAVFKTPRGKYSVRASAPMHLVEHYLAREGEWRLPVLAGVAEAPTLRHDGTLLCAEGYDSISGLLLNFGGVKFPPVPDEPTEVQALAALAQLKEPLKEFPFVPDDANAEIKPEVPSASRSVALSAILTPLVRTALRARPLHVHTAPAAGTGKSLLADVESIIATGKVAAVMAQGGDEAEDEKRLAGVMLQGDVMANLDNITRPLGGALLCQVLTQESVQIRVLGATGQSSVPCNTFFTCTGNNVILLEDMTRRALVCKLDAKMEAPETRKFEGDLKKEVAQSRPELVAAALTVLRGFIAAGYPGADSLPPFGSFEDWSQLVRGALVWLGESDPCKTREGLTGADPVRADLAALMAAIRSATALGHGSKHFSSSDLIAASNQYAELRTALESLFPRGATSKGVTTYLRKQIDRIVGGWSFREVRDLHSERWLFTLRRAGEGTVRQEALL